MKRTTDFQTIRSEGGLLPPDLLRRVLDPKAKLDGTRPEDYGLPHGERLNEVITQSWNRLRKHWGEFRAATTSLPEGEPGTGITNDKWSLPLLRELGFGLLPTSAGPEVGGRTYAINRFFGPVPIHLVGCGLSLDRRAAGVRGAAAINPHGLVQEFVNRSPGHRWAVVSNGLRFRILRDNQALSRQSFLEFDLEAMFAGEVFSDFVLLWLVAHATRFNPREAKRPETCWLEEWTKLAEEQGTRALGDLRGGVERALQILGEGFTSHPKNTALRDALRTGQVKLADFHGQLLRVVYRLIFLFVAEDRTLDGQPLLHPRDESDAARTARERFAAHYGTARLREMAAKIKGSRHGDLWRQFQLLTGALSGGAEFAAAREHLALPALGSFLWSPGSTATLNDAELTNHDLLEALRHLAFTRQGKVLRPVDYRNLGAEELGGVYESLLALTPQISADGARFTFAEFAGNERKTSGSYYTPDSLVQCLLDSALDPVVEEAIKGKTGADAETAILALKVCDPAVGSGHFLVGAAHRLARHLARVRALAEGESEPSPLLYQHALRDVIGRCLYGVDVNPMAAELCRVSLWLEALEPGKPLSFLDHHIRVGNSLLGATPELIAAGLPDEAFNAIEGDDKKVCAALKKRNKQERKGQMDMVHLMVAEPEAEYNSIAARTRGIDEAPDDTIGDVQRKAEQFQGLVVSSEYRHRQQVADAWCAAFVWKKQANTPAEPITTDAIRRLEADSGALAPAQNREVERLSDQHQYFHWHLAFPEVLARGGFDVVLGNPPWERVKLQEQEFFAQREPSIATAPNAAARKKAIAALKETNPDLLNEFEEAMRQAEGESQLLRSSGRYPLCGRGDINTYAVFAESMRDALSLTGRLGVIVPTGIATDDTTKLFFGDIVETRTLVSYFGFKNERFLFPRPVEHTVTFGLLTVVGRALSSDKMEFCWLAWTVEEMNDPARRVVLTADEIERLNPNTRTCPVFRSERDAEITKAIYRRVPVLIRGSEDGGSAANPWGIRLTTMFHMSNDSALMRTRKQLEHDGWHINGMTFEKNDRQFVPLLEGRLGHQFNHRFAREPNGLLTESLDTDLADPSYQVEPANWISKEDTDRYLERQAAACRSGLLGFRRIARDTDVRTVIACVLPWGAASYGWILTFGPAAEDLLILCGLYNSFVFDYCLRGKVGQPSITQGTFAQVACPGPGSFSLEWRQFIRDRVFELTYSADDLAGFARDLRNDCRPFRRDVIRRARIRAELDAAFFHFYGVSRDDAAYILNTFLVFKARDEERNAGSYETKRVILEIYDALAESIHTGQSYQSLLDPPPADPRCCHPPRDGEAHVPGAQPADKSGNALHDWAYSTSRR